MPPAARRSCDYPGCDKGPQPDDPDTPRGPYVTHQDCQTRVEVNEDLDRHIKMAHELPLKNREIEVKDTI